MNLTNALRHAGCALALTSLLAFAAGSNASPSTSKGDGGATSATETTSADPSEPRVTAAGATPPNYEYIRATCDNPKAGTCDEFYGLVPKFSPEMCPQAGGTFQTSTPKPHACPKTNLIGACHYAQSRAGEPGQYVNVYSSSPTAATAQADCIASNSVWIAAPTPPPSAAPAPAGGAKPNAKLAGPATNNTKKKK